MLLSFYFLLPIKLMNFKLKFSFFSEEEEEGLFR